MFYRELAERNGLDAERLGVESMQDKTLEVRDDINYY